MDPYQYQQLFQPQGVIPGNPQAIATGIIPPRHDSPNRFNNFGQNHGPSPTGTQYQISPPRYNQPPSIGQHTITQNQRVYSNQPVHKIQQANNVNTVQIQAQPQISQPLVIEKLTYVENRQEIDRLNTQLEYYVKLLNEKDQELFNLRPHQIEVQRLTTENQYLRSHIQELKKILQNNDARNKDLTLLTQELERLNNLLTIRNQENENLKANLRNSDSHRNNLENQINSLRSVENKVKLLETELNRLKDLVELKSRQSEDYRNKGLELERQLNDLRLNDRTNELEKKTQIQGSEIERLSANLRQKMEEIDQQRLTINSQEQRLRDYLKFESELRRLQELLNQKHLENEDLRNRLAESRNLQTKLIEYENQLAVLSTEIERLNINNKNKADEIESLKNRCYNFQNQIHELLTFEDQVQQLQELLHNRNIEIEEWKRRLNEAESDNRQLINQIKEYEVRYSQVVSDNQRMNQLIKSKLDDLQMLKNRLGQQEQTIINLRNFESKYRESEEQIVLLASENERIQSTLRNRNEELESLRRQLLEFEAINRENGSLRTDLSRLQDLLSIRNKEIDEWQSKFVRLDATIAEYRPLENRLREYEQETNRLNQILRSRIEEIDNLKNKNNSLEREISQLQYRSAQLDSLMSENERLTKLLRDLQSELEHWRYKYAEYSGLQSQNTELLALLVLTNAELESLRSRLNVGSQRDIGRLSQIDQPRSSSSVMNKNPSSNSFNNYGGDGQRVSNSQYGQQY